MAMEAGPRREFRLPKSAAEKYGIPHSSLCRYIHELEAGGWIEVRSMKLLRKPNEYRFALKWKGALPVVLTTAIPAAAGMATCGISAPEWSKRSRADRSLVARLWIITSLDDPCACRMVGQDTLSSCPGTVQPKCTLARKIVETRRCVIFPTNGNTAR